MWVSDPIYNQSIPGTLFRLLGGAPATNSAVLFADGAVLLVGALAIMRPRDASGRSTVPREALESSVVILSMVLLSPVSSKPHFVVLLLPAYCVARLATEGHDAPSRFFVSLALVLSVLGHRSITGETIGYVVQWGGGITACALALWLGCVTALFRSTAKI
jgi:hypothetical protein